MAKGIFCGTTTLQTGYYHMYALHYNQPQRVLTQKLFRRKSIVLLILFYKAIYSALAKWG